MNRFLKQIRIALAGVSVMVVSAACFAGTTIDLLVAYDRTAADYVAASGQTAESFAAQEIARMNEVVRNSKLDSYFTFRLVGVCSVGAAVADAGGADSGFGGSLVKLVAGTGAWRDVYAARDTYGADIVVTLTDTGSTSGIQGLGYALEKGQDIAESAPYAYCVCAIRSLDTSYTMVHEVGHIMGAGHPDWNPSSLKFDPGPQYDAAAAGFYVGDKVTVMGYRTADYAVIPYFSSPELAFEGATLGDAKHNNRQTLISTYKAISEYRKSKSSDPDDPIIGGDAFNPQKAEVWPGFVGTADAPTYVLQVKVGKTSKKGESKVLVTAIGLDGKKYTAKAVKVQTGGNPVVDFEVKKLGRLTLTLSANGFSGEFNGAPVVSGGNSAATTVGKATFTATDLTALPGAVATYFPTDEAVSRTEKKWAVVAKAGKLKYVILNKNDGLAGTLAPTGSNIAGLKLTYAPKTQTFKGSFKVWLLDESKGKLKSASVKVTGVVVDGTGYGEVTYKKNVIGELTVR